MSNAILSERPAAEPGESRTPLITCWGLQQYYPVGKTIFKAQQKVLKAIDGIDLRIYEGETLGLVGESGCGKSTLGRTILNLNRPTGGQVWYRDQCIGNYNFKSMRQLRKEMQIIFQDPFASLSPRMTIYQSVKAPLDVFKIGSEAQRKEKVESLLDYVGLGRQHMSKYPHEMSGGQRQRVVIARAMVLDPAFIVCDEPVSALDVSVRSQVLNLMKKVQRERNLAYLFISHDLSVVRYLCDRVAVMYLGNIVEIGTKAEIFDSPMHPYTKALLSAIPIADVTVKTKRIILQGDVPSPIDPPPGCKFHTRCPYAVATCGQGGAIGYTNITPTHRVACLRALEIS